MNVCGMVIRIIIGAKGDHGTFQVMGNFIRILNLPIDNQTAVLRQKLRKFPEGIPDIVQVPEKVQVIGLNIQDNADSGEKIEKTVGVFTGFRDKITGFSYTHIAPDILQYAADGQSGIQVSLEQNLADHGGGSGLAMGAADGNGHLVIFHNLSHKLSPGEAGKLFFMGGNVFGIIRKNGAGKNHAIDGVSHIFGALSIKYLNPL